HHCVVEGFEMLDVDGGEYADACLQEVEHVLVALLVFRPWNVRVREFIDQADFGLPSNNGIHVHLFQHDIAVFDLFARNGLQIANLRFRVRSAVSLDEADHQVVALAPEMMRVFEHLISLADTRGRSNVNPQPRALLLLEPREQRFTARADVSVSAHKPIPLRYEDLTQP